ncbi:MAG: hypothetical protein JRM95_06220 [Nitrososphaerota archaeon]|nr:hypothetical protein [Nitrososphaerota archaeon]MDG6968475.1 hypothetical protein [Nitrososphaerota archaeon]MDG6974409.1 hypothetical protein [Nitrososphaerota archaeon]
MKPFRDFKLKGKREVFVVVGFRYDQMSSLEYDQYKRPESAAAAVQRLLTQDHGADVISIRRVYLSAEEGTFDDPKLEEVLAP